MGHNHWDYSTTAVTNVGHKNQWGAATCEKLNYCILCNDIEGGRLGHYWRPGTHEGELICVRCAVSIYESSSEAPGPQVEAEPCTSSLGHYWEVGTREGEWICMRCAISIDD